MSWNKVVVSCWSLMLAVTGIAAAEVRLPAVFGDHMVLQTAKPVPIWGWSEPGAKITVQLQGESACVTATPDGTWKLTLPPMEAGGPHEITIRNDSEVLTLRDVLVGEVWLCSGQSNMVWPVRKAARARREIATSKDDRLRLLTVPRRTADTPQKNLRSGEWEACGPASVADFSAVGYSFGRSLRRHRNTPVGLIFSAWGGTRVEGWTRHEALAGEPMAKPILEKYQQICRNDLLTLQRNKKRKETWHKAAPRPRAENQTAPARPPVPPAPRHHFPSVLYNGMIAPLTPYAIRGVIWYQGEANVDRAYQYRTLFPLMIRDWRRCWGQGNFPFLFVQLANYRGAPPSEPVESAWAELREAQLMALSSPQTGMAVAIDLGKAETIHPKNKQDVGRRLAQIARAEVYGESITYSGPTYRCMGTEGSAIRIHFDHVDGGLATREGRPLTGFAIAGKDRHFVWADAAIEGNTVVVRSPWVPEPVAVRYAWASNPACNLINQAGLPASPFRTDDWPGSTFHARCPAKP